MFDNTRRLANKKASRPTIGIGPPKVNDGLNGDFSINLTDNGLKLYVKYSEQWFAFAPEVAGSSAEVAGSAGSSDQTIHILHGAFNSTTSSTSAILLPLTASNLASTSGSALNERFAFVFPYAGRVLNIMVRSEALGGDTVIKIYKAAENQESPYHDGILLSTSSTVDMNKDDKGYLFSFTTAEFKTGEAMSVLFNSTSSPLDTIFSIVLGLDIG